MARKQQPFSRLFLNELLSDQESGRRLWWLPWLLLMIIAASALPAYYLPGDFFIRENWGVVATAYSGVLAFNAITLALSWSAISGILEVISRREFSSFLKSVGALDRYRFYIGGIHSIQLVAASVTLCALVSLFLDGVPELIHRFLFGIMLTLTLYALRWSHGAVQMANDLISNYSTFDSLDEEARKRVRLAVNNDPDV